MEQGVPEEGGLAEGPSSFDRDEFEGLNAERMELMGLRVQRRKIELLAQELVALEGMYVSKVEDNIQLKGENRRLHSLIELVEAEKQELIEELELLREKHSNAIQQMDRMYSDNEQMQRIIETLGSSSSRPWPPGQRELQQQLVELQLEVAELSGQLERRKQSSDTDHQQNRLKATLDKEIRDSRMARSKAEQGLKLAKAELEGLKAESDRLKAYLAEQERVISELRARQAALKREHEPAEELGRGPPPSGKGEYIQRTRSSLWALKRLEMQKIEEIVEGHSLRAGRPHRY